MRPMIPCSAALAAMGVPARRWTTRTDLLKQLQVGLLFLDTAPLSEASVPRAASVAGISLHHFLRLFKEVHGVTPHRHLTRRRIDEAKRLLMQTQLSASEITLEIGLESASAFSRLFRAHVGVPPMVYRLKQQ